MKYKLRKNYPTQAGHALRAILRDRGVEDVEKFINPSFSCELNPYDLDNIEAAVDMLLRHLRCGSSILFIVDCDADGYTSASILWLYIKNIFPQADLNFMIHEHKQHGLHDVILNIIDDKQQYDLVICPDSASYDVDEHQLLNENGVDCLIIDHHEQLYDNDGNAVVSNAPNTIIVNNQLSNYSNKSLCGAGVVYKMCEVLDDTLGIQKATDYLDLVALGEIADVMDRTNTETNYLIMTGLKNIKNKGFQTLLEAQSYSLKERAIQPYEGLTPIDVAFYIAPLINALTRVGTM